MLNEKITSSDIKFLQRRVQEIKAVVKLGESPFELLSHLKTEITRMMHSSL